MARGPAPKKSATFRFFVEALTEGIRTRSKSFLSIAGFICALGFVYASNDSVQHWVHEKHTRAEVQEPVPAEESAEGNSRSPASAPGGRQFPQTSIEPSSRSAMNTVPERGAGDPDQTQNSGTLGSRTENYGGGSAAQNGPRGYSPGNSVGNNSNSAPVTAPKPVDPDLASSNGLGPQDGVFASPTPTSNISSGSGAGGNMNVAGPVLTGASGFQISSGGGIGQGSFMTAQVSVGEVTAPNYHENTQFILMSGISGLDSGE